MATARETLRQCVKRGVKFLNDVRPSWASKINTRKLDLGDCTLCVLGQLYGTDDDPDGFARGLTVLNGEVEEDPMRFGFDLQWGDSDDYEALTELWRKEIAAQRALRRKQKAAT